ncbi:MAG TPA: hypothetical protein VNA16_11510 [Abditibacteriaceae bacterium]|nr:hypothetical protein [Abditibacteriaceae bacterium]
MSPVATPPAITDTPNTNGAPDATPVAAEPTATPESTPAANATPDGRPSLPAPEAPGVPGLPQPATLPTQLFADTVRYGGGTIVAEGTEARPVRLESGALHIVARSVHLDVIGKTVRAAGDVTVVREREIKRRVRRKSNTDRDKLVPSVLRPSYRMEAVTETLKGSTLEYDFKTRKGHLGDAFLQLADFNIATTSLVINGQRYVARKVVLSPGGMTEAEMKIYGKPPFTVRARTVTAHVGKAGANSRLQASGAALYYKNTRLIPVPHYVFRLNQGSRNTSAFQVTPRISFNSADRVLATTRISFPLSGASGRLALNTDIGISARVGFRGGLSLDANHNWGTLSLRGKHSDIVSTQLTNRIELHRMPELEYLSPAVGLFKLPGGRRLGVAFAAGIGRFKERLIDSTTPSVRATRQQAGITLTTRLYEVDGPYLDLFARVARYPTFDLSYRNTGYEIGYYGNVTSRIRGQFSYRHTSLSGNTPFRFDEVEIPREARTTFDVKITPRWLIPIDLRYDLDRKEFRNKLFGIMRSYKTFAYGIAYDTARREVRLEFRNGF